MVKNYKNFIILWLSCTSFFFSFGDYFYNQNFENLGLADYDFNEKYYKVSKSEKVQKYDLEIPYTQKSLKIRVVDIIFTNMKMLI